MCVMVLFTKQQIGEYSGFSKWNCFSSKIFFKCNELGRLRDEDTDEENGAEEEDDKEVEDDEDVLDNEEDEYMHQLQKAVRRVFFSCWMSRATGIFIVIWVLGEINSRWYLTIL